MNKLWKRTTSIPQREYHKSLLACELAGTWMEDQPSNQHWNNSEFTWCSEIKGLFCVCVCATFVVGTMTKAVLSILPGVVCGQILVIMIVSHTVRAQGFPNVQMRSKYSSHRSKWGLADWHSSWCDPIASTFFWHFSVTSDGLALLRFT